MKSETPAQAQGKTRWRALVGGAALAAVGLVVLLARLWLRSQEEPPSPVADPRLTFASPYRNIRPEVGYVGDAACARCHRGVVEKYRKHPMGRSLAPLAAGPDSQGAFEAEGFRYRVERKGDRTFHRMTCLGPDGAVLADLKAEVAYVVGSGERGRSYLLSRDGYVFQSPITWFAEGKRWDLSPGYAGGRVGFTRAIKPECLFCHCNQAEHVPDTVNRYQPPIFRGHAIGCERCHGPGELHAARHDEGWVAEGEETDDTIVNPGRLEPALREAVCEQCHLQGASRVVRRGRGMYDYRPGMPLHLFWSIFVRPPEFTDQQFVGHVEQMHQSRCYRESQAPKKMGCVSCHDPHGVPTPDRKVAAFRQGCLKCHTETSCHLPPARRRETNAEDNCVACHMPRRPSTDITHTTTTDHRVVRRADKEARPPAPRRLRPGESPLLHFHAALADPQDPDRERDLGIALVEVAQEPSPVQRQLHETALGFLSRAPRRGADDVPAWEARARALGSVGRAREALTSAEEALARAPARELALAIAAAQADALGKRSQSIDYWTQALAVNPWSAHYRFRRAQLWSEAGDWPRVLAECDAVLRDDPANVEFRLLRVAYHLRRGDIDRAKAGLATVLALHPRDPDAVRRWFEAKSAR